MSGSGSGLKRRSKGLLLFFFVLFWIALILASASACIIAYVIFRHRKEIRLLDIGTIRAEQERKARDRIVRERFERNIKRWMTPVRRSFGRLQSNLTQSVRRMEGRLRRASGVPEAEEDGPSHRGDGKLAHIMEEAETCAREGKTDRAERCYLEVLKMNMRHVGAYRGLGALYLESRQFKQAKETFEFLIGINGANGEVYAGLARIAEVDGRIGEAEDHFRHALELDPKSPARSADMADFCLRHGKAEQAFEHAKQAMDLDAGHPRYLELFTESAILLRDREQAERGYERLRLLGHDQTRLRRLKEKLDALE